MVESVAFTKNGDRSLIYAEIMPQIEALVDGENDITANLANVAAVLKEAFGFFWVGFYLERQGELVLGPFQGPVACTRIGLSEGVCGHSFTTRETVIVPDVDKFPGHIACSSDTRSEIVVPLMGKDGAVLGVLDVDSTRLDDFSVEDEKGLKMVAAIIEKKVL